MKGEISRIILDKNYGFIETKENNADEEIFFHKSDLAPGVVFAALQKGQSVRFFVEETKKGKKATHIIKA